MAWLALSGGHRTVTGQRGVTEVFLSCPVHWIVQGCERRNKKFWYVCLKKKISVEVIEN